MDAAESAGAWPAAERTDVGCVRANNEDAVATVDGVWVVADGLGGHEGGEVASQTAVHAVVESLARRDPDGAPTDVLTRVFADAHQAVVAAGRQRRALRSMGTTLVVAYADGTAGVHIGTLGDSRAYLLTDFGLRQLTRDDNYAEDLLAAGVITAEQSRTHSGQYILTRALLADERDPGAPQMVSVSEPGRLLLCTDGLNSELDDPQIADNLRYGSVREVADRLVAAAVKAGGSDNVTVVVVDLPGSPDRPVA